MATMLSDLPPDTYKIGIAARSLQQHFLHISSVSDPIGVTEPTLKRSFQPLTADLGPREAIHQHNSARLKGDVLHRVLNA